MHIIDTSSEIVAFTRLYLAIFYSCVAIFYTIRIVIVKKKKMGDLVFPGERFCSTWWNHMIFRFFRLSIWMVCLFRLYFPMIDNYLGVISVYQTFPILLLGNILLTFGFLMTIVIHFRMGDKWRSGIDPAGPDQLITEGFYKYSRNPIFLGVAVSQIGFLLALPSIFSLLCLIIGLFTLHRQILSEECHLAKVFADKYKLYLSKVPRWL